MAQGLLDNNSHYITQTVPCTMVTLVLEFSAGENRDFMRFRLGCAVFAVNNGRLSYWNEKEALSHLLLRPWHCCIH